MENSELEPCMFCKKICDDKDSYIIHLKWHVKDLSGKLSLVL